MRVLDTIGLVHRGKGKMKHQLNLLASVAEPALVTGFSVYRDGFVIAFGDAMKISLDGFRIGAFDIMVKPMRLAEALWPEKAGTVGYPHKVRWQDQIAVLLSSEDDDLQGLELRLSLRPLGSQSAWMKLYLDDERQPPMGWTPVRWPDEAIELLKTGKVTELSLDHDLGDDQRGTGYDVLRWLEEAVATTAFCPPKLHVHTANTSAKLRMLQCVASIEKFDAERKAYELCGAPHASGLSCLFGRTYCAKQTNIHPDLRHMGRLPGDQMPVVWGDPNGRLQRVPFEVGGLIDVPWSPKQFDRGAP